MKRKLNILICVLFVGLLSGFCIAFWVLPDRAVSENENRTLRQLPTPTLSGCLNGSFTAAFTDYCSDQFPLRDECIRLAATMDLALGRGESGGVLYGRNGQQVRRLFNAYRSRTERAENTDYYDEAHVAASLTALSALRERLEAQGIPLTVLLAPRTVDVATAAGYPSVLSDRLHEQVETGLATVPHIDMTPDFRARFAAGEYVMYRTDHHWTTGGAYLAYRALMEAWGRGNEALSAGLFTVRRVEGFAGTTAARSGFPVQNPDVLELWETPWDTAYTVCTVTDGKQKPLLSGFVNEAYLTTRDKYGAFLDGTHRVITVELTDADPLASASRPRLLLARDSYASALIPFLARHFDIVAVDLSGGMTDLSSLAAAYDCTSVLVLCNLENLVTSDCLRNVE